VADNWIEPEPGLFSPEEWEAERRSIETMMDEHFGIRWRDWSVEEKARGFEELLATLPTLTAEVDQSEAFLREFQAFAELLRPKLEAAGPPPLPPSVWGPLLHEAVMERYGGYTSLALAVCRQLGYEPDFEYEPQEERVFSDEGDGDGTTA
jgi:hypothetical protein